MKKLLIISLIALFIAGAVGVGYAIQSASGPGAAGDIMGMQAGRYAGDAHRTFRLVRNGPASTTVWTAAAALIAGQLVIWDTTQSPYGADGVTVTTSTTTNDSRIAGMMVSAAPTRDASLKSIQGTIPVTTATEDVGQANWGWLQTYGLSLSKATVSANVASTNLLVGGAVGCSDTAGRIQAFVANASTATANGNAGFAMETILPSATGYIFLKCE